MPCDHAIWRYHLRGGRSRYAPPSDPLGAGQNPEDPEISKVPLALDIANHICNILYYIWAKGGS